MAEANAGVTSACTTATPGAIRAVELQQLGGLSRPRWRLGWKLLRSQVVEDYTRGRIDLGVFQLTCRACGGTFEQFALVHGRGAVPSRKLLERRNCPKHSYSRRALTADEVLAHELGVADLLGCTCRRCQLGLDLV